MVDIENQNNSNPNQDVYIINDHNPNPDPDVNLLTEEMKLFISKSKFIKMFSVIDIFFILMMMSFSPYIIFLTPLVLAGWFGAKNFQPMILLLYIIFIILEIVLRIILVRNMFGYISAGFSVYILCYVIKFTFDVMRKTSDELDLLRSYEKMFRLCGFI